LAGILGEDLLAFLLAGFEKIGSFDQSHQQTLDGVPVTPQVAFWRGRTDVGKRIALELGSGFFHDAKLLVAFLNPNFLMLRQPQPFSQGTLKLRHIAR
jgi:hypothetical protein